MKKQNKDELRAELDQLNSDLNKILEETPLIENEEDFEAIDIEEPEKTVSAKKGQSIL